MAGRARKQIRQFSSEPVNQSTEEAGVIRYRPGDVVRVELILCIDPCPPLLLKVERCDDRRGIVFGTITSSAAGLGKSLSCGAKLGVGYHLLRGNASIVGLR